MGFIFTLSPKFKGASMSLIAKVVVENATISFDKEFDYIIPQSLAAQLRAGCRVLVPFGSGNRRRVALVTEIISREDVQGLKSVQSQIDEAPILNEEFISLIHFLKNYTFCRYYDAVKILLPSGMNITPDISYTSLTAKHNSEDAVKSQIIDCINENGGKISQAKLMELIKDKKLQKIIDELLHSKEIAQIFDHKQKIQDEKSVMAKLSYEEMPPKLTAKQKLVWEMLSQQDASVKEIVYYLPITKNVVDNMVKKGYITLYEQPVYRNPHAGVRLEQNSEIKLSEEQNKAYSTLLSLLNEKSEQTALLYGVTGSGKTSVFLKLVEQTVKNGKTAIVMVPEISLTPQTVEKFHKLFGDRVAVLHSSLTMSQRMDEWKRINEGRADVVVGTRSAVFAPLKNIGIIVMDEEQEHTYKSEKSPRFHARDIALFRSRHHKALLLLASATPSIESYHRAKTGKYTLVHLTERYGGAILPDVYVVDTKGMEKMGMGISETVIEELYTNLQAGEQSILLLNRRGYNTAVKCSSCGEAVKCVSCDLPLTYHIKNRKLMCHYCGYSVSQLSTCGACGSELVRYTGMGTQLVEEELNKLFPEAKILRMDMDTTMSRSAYEDKFGAFLRGEYQIMLGTQMVAKGLNFPNVTFVGVLNPDQLLYSSNFRGYEKAFSLITQVVGRSGRGEKKGRAFIQTANNDHSVIGYATMQDYESFYNEEIIFRKLNLYPPFCKITCVGLLSENEKAVANAANEAAKIITKLAKGSENLAIKMLPPVPDTLYKAGGKYRYRILIKHKQDKNAYDLLLKTAEEFSALSEFKAVNMIIDTNYDG